MDRVSTISAIDAYAAKSGLKPTTICQYAIANRKFYDRMCNGYFHEVHAKKILDWIDQNPVEETIEAAE